MNIRLSRTLSLYIGKQFLLGIAMVFLVVAALALTIDIIELMRRAAKREDAAFAAVLQMGLLRLPSLAFKLLPFAALFGAMLTLTRLTRSQELVVSRAAGVSVWQFLMPGLALALIIGILSVTVFNPLASAMASRYELLENRYLRGQVNLLAVSASGLWLRQADAGGQSVVHAQRVSQRGGELSDVIIFLYEGSDIFAGRIDARSAELEPGHWALRDAVLTGPNQQARFFPEYQVPTTLTLDQIQDSFASPETMSFWALPAFIETMEATGFSALRHRLHWHSLMSVPLLLVAMVLIAATFSLRLTRRGGTGLLLGGGVLAGFLLYFTSDIVFALGLSGGIPVIMAAWTPAGVTALLGIATLMHLEDG